MEMRMEMRIQMKRAAKLTPDHVGTTEMCDDTTFIVVPPFRFLDGYLSTCLSHPSRLM